jgi:WASH complex subunit 7, N-terminal
MRLVDWIVRLNSDVIKQGPRPGGDREYLERLANIIVQGINLAVQIKRTMKTLMMLYDITGASLNAERLKDIL